MTDPTAPADMTKINADIESVRDWENGYKPDPNSGGIATLLSEYDRLKAKLDAINKGETVLIMNDEDRAKAVPELDDASLAKWSRATLVHLTGVADRTPARSLIAMHGVIAMARAAHAANASTIRVAVDGITYRDMELGNWEVIVRRQGPTDAEDMLWRFRHFVDRNATQWRLGAGHGHPIWPAIAEALGRCGLNDVPIRDGAEWRFSDATNRTSLEELEGEQADGHA